MFAMRIVRHELIFMGLVALDEVAEQCRRTPYARGFPLRVTLAMLYAFSDGKRAPYDAFWRECAEADRSDDAQAARLWRKNQVSNAYREIRGTLGIAETTNLIADIRAARRAPHEQVQQQAPQRASQSESEAARQRFAEMLRTSMRERTEAKERVRAARS